MSQPVTWDQIVQAAAGPGQQIAAQGVRAESLTVWVNALVESAGGSIIDERLPTTPRRSSSGWTPRPASGRPRSCARSATRGAGPRSPRPSEDANATSFEAGDAAFMVNYPFVWPRALAAVEAGTLDQSVPDDYGVGALPAGRRGQAEPRRPTAGSTSASARSASTPTLAYEAAECIVSEENQAYYFVSNGNPASRPSVFDDPEVMEEFPQAPVIRESLELAAPRPQTAVLQRGLRRHPARVPPAGARSTRRRPARRPTT